MKRTLIPVGFSILLFLSAHSPLSSEVIPELPQVRASYWAAGGENLIQEKPLLPFIQRSALSSLLDKGHYTEKEFLVLALSIVYIVLVLVGKNTAFPPADCNGQSAISRGIRPTVSAAKLGVDNS